MKQYQAGQIVKISAPGRRTAEGIILAARRPAKLPEIAGAPNINQVRAALTGIRQILLIEIQGARPYIFAALTTANGEILDLQRQHLTIETQ